MILREKDLIVHINCKDDKNYTLLALHPSVGVVKYTYIGFKLSDAKVKFKIYYESIGEYENE